MRWQVYIKPGAFVGYGYGLYIATMIFNDLLYYGQPYSCTGILIFSMQALEYFEYLAAELRFETDAVVFYADPAIPAFARRQTGWGKNTGLPADDSDVRRPVVAGEFERIADQLL